MAACGTCTDKWEGKTQTTFIKILSLAEYDPHKLFWKYLEEVSQLGIERRKNEATAKEERDKVEYIKNLQDTICACKACRNAGNGETTHLTNADTNKGTHCLPNMYDWIMTA